jgi:hypothetical protein
MITFWEQTHSFNHYELNENAKFYYSKFNIATQVVSSLEPLFFKFYLAWFIQVAPVASSCGIVWLLVFFVQNVASLCKFWMINNMEVF